MTAAAGGRPGPPRVQLDRASAVSLALERHHLTPDAAGQDPLGVARDLLGLHATDPFSPYLQVWARVRQFEQATLDRLLYDDPRLARVSGMRGTLFIEPADLLPLVFAATKRIRMRGRDRYLEANGLTEERYARLAEKVETTLVGRAMTARALRTQLGVDRSLTAVMQLMSDEGRIIRWRPAGGRRDATSTYRVFGEALPGVDLTGWDEAEAISRLAELYVRHYGPATEEDLSWWSGLDRRSLRAGLARLGPAILTVGIAGLGDRYLVHHDEPATSGLRNEVHGCVSFLPILDPYLMGYRDRLRFIDPRHYDYVFDRGGNSTSVILVDGRVAGVWDWRERPWRHVRLHLFESVIPATRASILQRGEELGSFVAGETVPVVEVDAMKPLTERSAWTRSPLADPD